MDDVSKYRRAGAILSSSGMFMFGTGRKSKFVRAKFKQVELTRGLGISGEVLTRYHDIWSMMVHRSRVVPSNTRREPFSRRF